MHNLLPTKERVNRLSPSTAPLCKLCQDQSVETLQHALFECSNNIEASQSLVTSLQALDNQLTPAKILRLEIFLEDHLQLPTIWYLAAFLRSIWSCRVNGKRARLYTIRAEVESKVALLRETRHSNSAEVIFTMLKVEQ